MTIFNLGGINVDYFYRVPHLPAPGETVNAQSLTTGLGGKGANMSVAAARAGARVHHVGALGPASDWVRTQLQADGIDTTGVKTSAIATGQGVIYVDDAGENSIVVFPGANRDITEDDLKKTLSKAGPDDIIVTQNETSAQAFWAESGSKTGARVAYAAAPFDADRVRQILPFVDLLIMNQIEGDQLSTALGQPPQALGPADVVITLGAQGARWVSAAGVQDFAARKVDPVDTTGAGDTFTGYLLAGLDQGLPMAESIALAVRAAALMVTRLGTADVIPTRAEVDAF